jgi:hypothetical protein
MTGSALHLIIEKQGQSAEKCTWINKVLPSNELSLGYLSIARGIHLCEDLGGTLLRISIAFSISFANKIVLK